MSDPNVAPFQDWVAAAAYEAQSGWDHSGPDPSDYEPGLPDCDGSGEIDYVCDHNHAGPNCMCQSIECPGCKNCGVYDDNDDEWRTRHARGVIPTPTLPDTLTGMVGR